MVLRLWLLHKEIFSKLCSIANLARDTLIVADNYCSTTSLVNHLKDRHGMYYLGTLRSNLVPADIVLPSIDQYAYSTTDLVLTLINTLQLPYSKVVTPQYTIFQCQESYIDSRYK